MNLVRFKNIILYVRYYDLVSFKQIILHVGYYEPGRLDRSYYILDTMNLVSFKQIIYYIQDYYKFKISGKKELLQNIRLTETISNEPGHLLQDCMCAQRRLKVAFASLQSHQCLPGALHWQTRILSVIRRIAKPPIRLHRCAG